jgi:anti-sigma regulatory factor (Ser/Thr protein kinase)
VNHVTGPQAADVESQYHAEFALGAHSARHLRRVLRLYLVRSGLSDVADAAELALTELVANVVRHVPGRRGRVCFLLRPGGVRVEVADGCPELPVPAAGDALGEGGRGLVIVAAVTDRWGVTPYPDGRGKTVWFECVGAADEAGPRVVETIRGPGQEEGGGPPRGQTASVTGAFAVAGSPSPSAGVSASFGPAPLSGTSFTKTAATSARTATTEPSRNAVWVPADTACW